MPPKGSSRGKKSRTSAKGHIRVCKSLDPIISDERAVDRLIVSRNRKKGRILYKEVIDRGIRVHRSVKTRMEAKPMPGKKKPYRPKVRFTINGEVRRLERSEWLAGEHFEWVD